MFDLFAKKHGKAKEFVRACNVYCRPDANQAIVAVVINHAGLLVEKPNGAKTLKFCETSAIHDSVRSALETCEYSESPNHWMQKKSDWPAFAASGCKSMRQFEKDFIRLSVMGMNEQNAGYRLETPEFGEFGLHLTMTIASLTSNFGQAVDVIIKNFIAFKIATDSSPQ